MFIELHINKNACADTGYLSVFSLFIICYIYAPIANNFTVLSLTGFADPVDKNDIIIFCKIKQLFVALQRREK